MFRLSGMRSTAEGIALLFDLLPEQPEEGTLDVWVTHDATLAPTVGYDEYLGTTWRSQMLELRFDANQGRFLGQPAGSDTTSTIPGSDKNRPDGELEHLLAFPVYQLALPFPQEAWCQLE